MTSWPFTCRSKIDTPAGVHGYDASALCTINLFSVLPISPEDLDQLPLCAAEASLQGDGSRSIIFGFCGKQMLTILLSQGRRVHCRTSYGCHVIRLHLSTEEESPAKLRTASQLDSRRARGQIRPEAAVELQSSTECEPVVCHVMEACNWWRSFVHKFGLEWNSALRCIEGLNNILRARNGDFFFGLNRAGRFMNCDGSTKLFRMNWNDNIISTYSQARSNRSYCKKNLHV